MQHLPRRPPSPRGASTAAGDASTSSGATGAVERCRLVDVGLRRSVLGDDRDDRFRRRNLALPGGCLRDAGERGAANGDASSVTVSMTGELHGSVSGPRSIGIDEPRSGDLSPEAHPFSARVRGFVRRFDVLRRDIAVVILFRVTDSSTCWPALAQR